MIKFLATAAIVFASSSSFASYQFGTINCNVLGNDNLFVQGHIFGEEQHKGFRYDYADFTLDSYNKTKKEYVTLREWKNVTFSHEGALALVFKNAETKVIAAYDDVGAISSIQVDGKELALECQISIEEF